MNIHEFQAKKILSDYHISVPEFYVFSSLKELEEILDKTNWQSGVIKVQIHAGGRGKAGGVKVGKDRRSLLEIGKELLGKKIINEQTGPDGLIAHQLLISPLVEIQQEYYLGLTIDRERAEILLIASPVGGMDIEKVAEEEPEKVLFIHLPEEGTFRSYQMMRLAKVMGWKDELLLEGIQMIKSLVKVFKDYDATLLEINPLVKTSDGSLVALDAKLTIDENALFRQPQIKEFYDPTQIHSNEVLAQEHGLAYIALDGNIGCMVNGAGLAMATMDVIHHFGGSAANFLDVGGSATKEKIAEGFKIILEDPKVKAILVNIFGGIMNCQTLAEGIIEGAKDLKGQTPSIAVRMEGTNVEEGKRLLEESNLNIIIADTMMDAANAIVNKTSGTC